MPKCLKCDIRLQPVGNGYYCIECEVNVEDPRNTWYPDWTKHPNWPNLNLEIDLNNKFVKDNNGKDILRSVQSIS